MSSGVLEVQLIDAKKLKDRGFFSKMDPYVLIHYGNQECKSKVARGQGRNPIWNQSFTFKVEYDPKEAYDQHKISFRIMDKDTFSKDDFVGEAVIYAKDIVSLGIEKGVEKLQPTKYRVVLASKAYYGEIRVGITFFRKEVEDELHENVGGQKKNSTTLAYLMKTQSA